MGRYVLMRVATLGVLLLLASILLFALVAFAPGDPAELILLERSGGEPPTGEAVQALRAELRLDDPAPLRYVRWLGDVARGEFGTSFRTGRAVSEEFGGRLGCTVLLGLPAGGLAVLLSLFFGVGAAARAGRLWDRLLLVVTALLAATPVFVLGLVFVLTLSVGLNALPAAGSSSPAHFVLPALTLGLAGAAVPARMLRSGMLAELSCPYVTAARGRGLPEDRILYVHALRNALLPWLTLCGLMLRGLLAGTVLVEAVFDFPGIGSWIVEAVPARDIPVLQAGLLVFITATALTSLLTDFGYAALDPRIQLNGGRA